MVKQKNKEFADRLTKAKEAIGREYVPFVRKKYPDLTSSQIRNVVNNGVENYQVLVAMEDVARIIEKNFAQKEQ